LLPNPSGILTHISGSCFVFGVSPGPWRGLAGGAFGGDDGRSPSVTPTSAGTCGVPPLASCGVARAARQFLALVKAAASCS
jgi:hypothetical protein